MKNNILTIFENDSFSTSIIYRSTDEMRDIINN
jgi:hypothetical protein